MLRTNDEKDLRNKQSKTRTSFSCMLRHVGCQNRGHAKMAFCFRLPFQTTPERHPIFGPYALDPLSNKAGTSIWKGKKGHGPCFGLNWIGSSSCSLFRGRWGRAGPHVQVEHWQISLGEWSISLPSKSHSQFFSGTNYFSLLFHGCPTKHGLPQKGFPFFPGSLSN